MEEERWGFSLLPPEAVLGSNWWTRGGRPDVEERCQISSATTVDLLSRVRVTSGGVEVRPAVGRNQVWSLMIRHHERRPDSVVGVATRAPNHA